MIIDNLLLLKEIEKMASDAFVHVFVFLVLFDILTGISKAIFNKKANSTKGLTGIIKHVLVVVLVFFTYPYLNILKFEWASIAFIVFFITTYGISIVENLGILGIPLPTFVKERLNKLHELSNQGKINEE